MSKLLPGILAVVLSACTTMESYFPNDTKTVVAGHEYLVQEINRGTYRALPNDPARGSMFANYDAQVWAENITAIEQVTGCTVIAGTARHDANITVAGVAC